MVSPEVERLPEVGASSSPGVAPGIWAWSALTAAVVTLAGSLYLSVGMGLKACPLCFYQRTFVMGVLAVLGVGLLAGVRPARWLSLLALPMAVGGFGVAAFHVYLELAGRLECPAGVLGVGTAPQQSLAALTVLLAIVGAGAVRDGGAQVALGAAAAGAVVLGALLAVASVVSAPPMPQAPAKPYEQPLDVCRPPYSPS